MDRLRSYFSSGWLFFLPYLAVYLAFWIAGGAVKTALCFYWTLHLFHLVTLLAVVWKTALPRQTILLFFGGVWMLFLIPGAYLEFPSDNWSHLEWIFVWNTMDSFSDPSPYKYKTGTFLATSWLQWLPMSWRFAGISLYSATLAALLIYQIWRFLRVTGLSEFSASLASVGALLFLGMPIQFGFYYSLSSSVPALIGVFAGLTALVTALSCPDKKKRWPKYAAVYGAFAVVTLNHLQGTGMLILGCLAVLAWTLQRRIGIWWSFLWLGGLVIAGLAAGLGLVAYSDAGKEIWDALLPLRQDGWLTPWGAIPFWHFDGLNGEGPATRFLEVVTWPGLVNLMAAAWLLWRGRVLGWITLAPVFALLYPVSGTALAWIHTRGGDHLINIITYHRYLLMILPMAALILVIQDGIRRRTRTRDATPGRLALTAWTCIALLVLTFSGVYEHRHWLGKWRSFTESPLPSNRLAFLAPLGDWFENQPDFRKPTPFVIADPLTFTYLISHFGVRTVTEDTWRRAVNDRINLVGGQFDRLSSAVAQAVDIAAPFCVLVLDRDPDLPLYYSWTGQMSRHWPSFAINETLQFDPDTLRWCEQNLTPAGGWQTFDAPPWYRVYFRPGTKGSPAP